MLEDQVVPTFYDRDVDDLPRRWIEMMMNSISTLAWRFSAHRMVMDYTRWMYVPTAGGVSCDMDLRWTPFGRKIDNKLANRWFSIV